jgi:hypothetical protein
MKISYIKITLAAFLLSIGTSCTSDLDLLPTNDITSETVYKTPQGYKQGLAKVYSAFALTGNTGGTGALIFPHKLLPMKETPISYACIGICRKSRLTRLLGLGKMMLE